MEKGQIVTIYEDPVTQTKIEGEAKLLGKIAENTNLEDWKVEFLDDGYRTERVIRINEEPCKEL